MGFISHFLAGGLFNRSEMNAKLDEISDALNPSWKLIAKIDNTVGYSGEWEAPDVFGDGLAYDLGVYMIGGGGSGGAAGAYEGNTYATGGASGYGKNVILNGIIPGVKYAWVIGKGGASVSSNAGAGNYTDGKAGGTTSFGGHTAAGGDGGHTNAGANGGQGSDASDPIKKVAPLGCAPSRNSSDYYGGSTQSPREGQNQFDQTMLTLSAGGGLRASNSTYQFVQTTVNDSFGKAGAAGVGTGATATGYGNGGGASGRYASSGSSKSGAGSDGVIFLYARKAVTE